MFPVIDNWMGHFAILAPSYDPLVEPYGRGDDAPEPRGPVLRPEWGVLRDRAGARTKPCCSACWASEEPGPSEPVAAAATGGLSQWIRKMFPFGCESQRIAPARAEEGSRRGSVPDSRIGRQEGRLPSDGCACAQPQSDSIRNRGSAC